MHMQLESESMQQKCDAWREEVEKLSPLRVEVAQLHQENARLQQDLAQASKDNVGLVRQLQMFSASEKVRVTSLHTFMQLLYVGGELVN